MPQIILSLTMPDGPAGEPPCPPVPVEEQVRDAIELIDSGHDSRREWEMITRLHAALSQKKSVTPRIQNLLNMIEPVLAKFGYHQAMPNK